jgi:hypothetical protein
MGQPGTTLPSAVFPGGYAPPVELLSRRRAAGGIGPRWARSWAFELGTRLEQGLDPPNTDIDTYQSGRYSLVVGIVGRPSSAGPG